MLIADNGGNQSVQLDYTPTAADQAAAMDYGTTSTTTTFVDTSTLSGILSASGQTSTSSSSSSDNVSSYTQPVSVPSPTPTQPLNPDDPRNTEAFAQSFMAAHNGALPTASDFAAWRQSLIPPMPTDAGPNQHYMYYPQTGWKLYWNVGYGPGAWGSSLQTSGGSSSATGGSDLTSAMTSTSLSAVVDLSTISSIPVNDYTNLDITTPPANGGSGSVESAPTITADAPVAPQPSPAIPAPTFALDTPENLYIDPSSFVAVPITETVIINGSATTISSIVYTTSVKFDSVDGAISYNYRISATV